MGQSSIIAIDQSCGSQASFLRWKQNAIDGTQEARIVGRNKEDQRSNEDRRIKKVATLVALNKASKLLVVAYVTLAEPAV